MLVKAATGHNPDMFRGSLSCHQWFRADFCLPDDVIQIGRWGLRNFPALRVFKRISFCWQTIFVHLRYVTLILLHRTDERPPVKISYIWFLFEDDKRLICADVALNAMSCYILPCYIKSIVATADIDGGLWLSQQYYNFSINFNLHAIQVVLLARLSLERYQITTR